MMARRQQAERSHQDTRAKLEPILSSEQLLALNGDYRKLHDLQFTESGRAIAVDAVA